MLLKIIFFSYSFFFINLSAFEFENFINQFFSSNVHNDQAIINWATENLPQNGVLKENHEGFVYLKVDDGYINQLFQFVDDYAYEKPPYFRRSDSPGAHISVFYVQERKKTGVIHEIGDKFTFKIVSVAYVPPKTQKYIVLKISSPELENLRTKYDLSPYLKGHDFHITIAKRR